MSLDADTLDWACATAAALTLGTLVYALFSLGRLDRAGRSKWWRYHRASALSKAHIIFWPAAALSAALAGWWLAQPWYGLLGVVMGGGQAYHVGGEVQRFLDRESEQRRIEMRHWEVRKPVEQRLAHQAMLRSRTLDRVQADALRKLMDPHFLFNALNGIMHDMMQREWHRALRHLSAFNRLAERQIHAGQNGWLPLLQQWESLHDYLQLEVRRLDRPITWNLLPPDPALAQCAIPSLVVQPLVENALWHGLGGTSCQGAGTVTVSATAEGDGHILIEVHNTPSPAPEYDPDPVRPEVSEPRRRHASDLIQQRLTLLDRSGKSGIEMNHNDAGTLARLVVPTKPA